MSKLPALQKVGYGLMGFTWIPSRKFTQEQYNETLKTVIEKSGASEDVPLFLNGGEFYGIPGRYENIEKLGQFFKSHPELADKVYVSIKGGVDAHWSPDTSAENLDTTLRAITKNLQPLYEARSKKPKTLDMFTVSRVGKEPIEEVLSFLTKKQDEGVFTSICLSEVSPATLTKALKVAKVTAIEMEYSLFERYLETNGIFELAHNEGIPVVCYSPLGKGLLAGLKASDISEDDFRKKFDRFNDESAVSHNEKLVLKVQQLAKRSNITPAQLALSYITTVSGSTLNGVKYPRLIPIPGSANATRQLENLHVVELEKPVLEELSEFLQSFKTEGYRYNAQFNATLDK